MIVVVCTALCLAVSTAVLAFDGVLRATNDEQGRCRASCNDTACFFELSVDPFAGETGYFRVAGCDGVQPTLVVDANKRYCFLQHNATNWMHPGGFGYFPDGALKDQPELEPGVNPYDASCEQDLSCQRPMYYLNGEFLGNASNPEDFGLDVYEPKFQLPRAEWVEEGNFHVCLTITQSNIEDLFFFCHVHSNMSLRIKIADDGVLRQPNADVPPLGYEYDMPEEFDKTCGTWRVAPFQNSCGGSTFVCNQSGVFGQCLNAIDCAMHIEMRTMQSSDDRVAFVDQMIPHHHNAVNMAKLLLKVRGDSLDEDFTNLLWDIINTQNMQITMMRQFLHSEGLRDRERICDAPMCHIMSDSSEAPTPTPTPTCLDASWVASHHGGYEVHAEPIDAQVLCFGSLPCATAWHVVSNGGTLMTMAELCAVEDCVAKRMLVNGVQHARHHLMPCERGVCVTTLDASMNSAWKRFENRVVHRLLQTGVPGITAFLTRVQLWSISH